MGRDHARPAMAAVVWDGAPVSADAVLALAAVLLAVFLVYGWIVRWHATRACCRIPRTCAGGPSGRGPAVRHPRA